MTDNAVDSTWVLIPVHNRREITLQCLSHLKETQDWERFNVVVIDDGSTDGTSEAVETDFPSVTVLEGDGSLWWGGAIRKGMEFVMDQGGEVFIWLNDDVLPDPHSVTKLSNKAAELGDTILTTRVETDTDHEYTTCNRKTRVGMRVVPYESDAEIQYCDATAGKFTAIPREIVETIGLPDDTRFPHNFCDYDYTYRATEHGFRAGVYTDVSALDHQYQPRPPRLSPEFSLSSIVKTTFSPTEQAGYNLRTKYRQCKRFCGPPFVMSYAVFLFYFMESVVLIMAKLILTVVKDEQKLK